MENSKLDECGVDLKNGGFYWVIPAYCPDVTDDWSNKLQPALFVDGKWRLLSTENEWPVVFVGDEILPPKI